MREKINNQEVKDLIAKGNGWGGEQKQNIDV